MAKVQHYLFLVPASSAPKVYVHLEPKESTPEFYHFATVYAEPCMDETAHLLFKQSTMAMLKQLSQETQDKYWNQSRSAIGNLVITHIPKETQDDNTTSN